MRNFIKSGDRASRLVPTGGVSGGDVAVILSGATGVIGVWLQDYAAGATGVVVKRGVVELPKTAGGGTALVEGEIAYWDVADGAINDDPTGNTRAGRAFAAAADAATTILIDLNT